jgi:adenine C2-methylase RlmN of 23S rRNA A2503 and tRNA A37
MGCSFCASGQQGFERNLTPGEIIDQVLYFARILRNHDRQAGASDNALQDRLVPINRKYPLEQLIPTCQEYVEATSRRITFEYILFDGINDSPDNARSLAGLLGGMNCHMNLISANRTDTHNLIIVLHHATQFLPLKKS